jgi:hypothetical protein
LSQEFVSGQNHETGQNRKGISPPTPTGVFAFLGAVDYDENVRTFDVGEVEGGDGRCEGGGHVRGRGEEREEGGDAGGDWVDGSVRCC